jgi:hypothetical protein
MNQSDSIADEDARPGVSQSSKNDAGTVEQVILTAILCPDILKYSL